MRKWIGLVSVLLLLVVVASLGQWWPPKEVEADTPLFFATTADGTLGAIDSTWDATHDRVVADMAATAGLGSMAVVTKYGASLWEIDKGALYFNTTSIPDDAEITSAHISLYVYDSEDGDAGVWICLTNGQPDHPTDALVVGDFLYTQYTGKSGDTRIDDFVIDSYNEMAVTPAWINVAGTTKLLVTTDYDIDDIAPSGENFIYWNTADAASNQPYLHVIYKHRPKIHSSDATLVTATSARLWGEVDDNGTYDVTSIGFVWDTTVGNLNYANDSLAPAATGCDGPPAPGYYSSSAGSPYSGTYSYDISGLSPGTTYYWRPLGANSIGWNRNNDYSGDPRSFTTWDYPIVDTHATTSITNTTATLNGDIAAVGSDPSNCDYYGFIWKGSADPGDPGDVDPSTNPGGSIGWKSGAGNYPVGATSHAVISLVTGVQYHVRAAAHNTAGWDYGPDVTFNTTNVLPTITLSAATSITNTTATLNGNITGIAEEAPTVTMYWGETDEGVDAFAWDHSGAPTSPAQPQGIAAFLKNVTGLPVNTTCYFRAAATNKDGTVWAAATLSFATTNVFPTVSTQDADSILDTSATLNGTIVNVGGDPHCDYEGFVWDDVSVPIDPGNVDPSSTAYNGPPHIGYYMYSGSFTAGVFDIGMSGGTYGLITKTTYYFRAFAWNSAGWAYGDEKSFTTKGLADVTTVAATSVLEISALMNGTVTAEYGTVTRVGFQWGLTAPAYGSAADEVGSLGDFDINTSIIGALTPGTKYHYRATVLNEYGVNYGSDLTFTTLPEGPTGLAVFSTGYTTATLTWTSGLHAAKTYIYYSDNAFPTHTPPAAWPVGGTAGYGGASGAYGGAGSADIISLSTGTHYYARAWSWVSGSNVWSNDYSDVEFTTGTIPPQNFIVKVVSSTSFHMWWKVSGATTDNAVINYNLSTYPTSPPPTPLINDVNIYKELNGVPGVWDYLYEGASPGTTYFLSIWFQNGLVYTASDNAVVTTPAASSEDILFPTVDNTTYSQVDSSGLTGAPGYGIMAWVATCMVISTDNWFMLIFALMVAFGVALIGIVTRSVIATLFIGLILTWLGVTLHLLPLWYVLSLMILAPVPAYIRGGGESTMG